MVQFLTAEECTSGAQQRRPQQNEDHPAIGIAGCVGVSEIADRALGRWSSPLLPIEVSAPSPGRRPIHSIFCA